MTKDLKADGLQKFIIPLLAAALGGAPSTYISVEMYSKIAEKTVQNQTELMARARWMARQEMEVDTLKAHQFAIQKDISKIEIKIAGFAN